MEVLSGKWRGRVIRYAPLLLWIGVIFFLSSSLGAASNTSRIIRPLLIWLFPDITEPSLQVAHYWVRKGAHFTAYAVLAFLSLRAFKGSSKESGAAFLYKRRFTASLLLVAAIAIIDETNQSFLNSRTGSIWDILLDCAGGLTMLLALYIFRNHKRKISTR